MIHRINEFIEKNGISVRAFEQKIGASNGLIRKAIANNTDIQSKWISAIIDNFPQINPDWLLTGDGEMLRTVEEEASGNRDNRIEKAIPLIPMDAFAGYPPEQYSDLPVEDYYHVTEFAKADFLIRVKGDSMTPKLNGGDIVACKKIYERLFFQWHRIYVVYTKSQGVMIKRVEHSDRDGCIRLVSDNPSYQPFDIPESDISDIALVMGAITLE